MPATTTPTIHPEILEAISAVNQGHTIGYGNDRYTDSAVRRFKEHFGTDTEVFFVFNGTAANCLSLKALTESYHAVICPESSHIYTDECGAPEKFTGCKLVPLSTVDGKLTIESVRAAYHDIGDQHHVQPRVISITQATETGRVYKPSEIRALARFAHEPEMFLHVDGARIANAAASLNQTLRQATRDLGVDVLSFGGTKNGAMGAEAVVFFDRKLAQDFLYRRKQGMQLASKMRFHLGPVRGSSDQRLYGCETPATPTAWLGSWKRKSARFRNVKIVYPVEANGVFVKIPRGALARLRKRYFFYVWNEEDSVVRWMCSFDTTEEDVKQFAKFVAETVAG